MAAAASSPRPTAMSPDKPGLIVLGSPTVMSQDRQGVVDVAEAEADDSDSVVCIVDELWSCKVCCLAKCPPLLLRSVLVLLHIVSPALLTSCHSPTPPCCPPALCPQPIGLHLPQLRNDDPDLPRLRCTKGCNRPANNVKCTTGQ